MTSMHKPQRKFTDETPEWTPVEGDAPHQIKQARNDALQEAMAVCQQEADEAKAEGLPPVAMGANFCRDAITALMETAP